LIRKKQSPTTPKPPAPRLLPPDMAGRAGTADFQSASGGGALAAHLFLLWGVTPSPPTSSFRPIPPPFESPVWLGSARKASPCLAKPASGSRDLGCMEGVAASLPVIPTRSEEPLLALHSCIRSIRGIRVP